MTNETILLILLGFSFLIYILTKIHHKLGSTVLFIVSGSVFGYILSFYNKLPELQGFFSGMPAGKPFFFNETYMALPFSLTPLSWFFLILGLFTITMVTLFSIQGNSDIKTKSGFNFMLSLILISLFGVFTAQSLFSLFIFWELISWSSFFIISMGKKEAKKAGILYLFLSIISGFFILFVSLLPDPNYSNPVIRSIYQYTPYILMIAAFIKAGVYPLHFWLPKTHGNAPNLFSSILSGFLIKLGAYLVLLTILFNNFFQWYHIKIVSSSSSNIIPLIIAIFGALSIFIGTIGAIMQEDMKYLIAYSSVSHSGYIMLGLAYGGTYAFAGGMMHISVHVLTALGMFLSAAAVYKVTGTTKMSELGGLVKKMPVTFTTYLIAIISLAGIPPMAGFISKWLIYQQIISRGDLFFGFFAFFGSIGSFMYVFRPLAAVFLGQLPARDFKVKEVPPLMQLPMIIISGLTLFLGIFPSFILEPIKLIEQGFGIPPLKFNLYSIATKLTFLQPLTIFIVFGMGVIFVMILFFILARSTKVEQHEQYTAGEIVPELETQPDIYHYAKSFYKPFERMFEKIPLMENFFYGLVRNFQRLFKFIKNFIFYNTVQAMLWIGITGLSVLSILALIYFRS